MLRGLSRDDAAVEAVARYCANPFPPQPLPPPPVFPLATEPHVADWSRYAAEAGGDPFAYLQRSLPQLGVPIRAGISKTDAYGRVARRGEPCLEETFGERLRLQRPQALRLVIHQHPAGALPVLVSSERGDFETLVRALACRSEPEPISSSVNAQMVAGFINWERVQRYRDAWLAEGGSQDGWPEEMARAAREESWRFYDRFMLTCERPYSDVSASQLGLAMSEADWVEKSTLLRVEHEFTHYATKRAFGAMSLHLFDETIADFMGTTLALGTFRAEWFLRFLGLEAWPAVRTPAASTPTGRTWRGRPSSCCAS